MPPQTAANLIGTQRQNNVSHVRKTVTVPAQYPIVTQVPVLAKLVRQVCLIGMAVPVQHVPPQTAARLTGTQAPKSAKRVRQTRLIGMAVPVQRVQQQTAANLTGTQRQNNVCNAQGTAIAQAQRRIVTQAPVFAKPARQANLIGMAVPVQRVLQQTAANLTGTPVQNNAKPVRQAYTGITQQNAKLVRQQDLTGIKIHGYVNSAQQQRHIGMVVPVQHVLQQIAINLIGTQIPRNVNLVQQQHRNGPVVPAKRVYR